MGYFKVYFTLCSNLMFSLSSTCDGISAQSIISSLVYVIAIIIVAYQKPLIWEEQLPLGQHRRWGQR